MIRSSKCEVNYVEKGTKYGEMWRKIWSKHRENLDKDMEENLAKDIEQMDGLKDNERV